MQPGVSLLERAGNGTFTSSLKYLFDSAALRVSILMSGFGENAYGSVPDASIGWWEVR